MEKKIANTAKAARVFADALSVPDPESMTRGALEQAIRTTYRAAKGLRPLPDDHPLSTLIPILNAHQSRLWEEYKRRFGQKDRWPSHGRPPGFLTPAGYRKAHCDPVNLRKENLRELRKMVEVHKNNRVRITNFIDPVMTLEWGELNPVIYNEYLPLVKAEIKRRDRIKGKAA